MKHLKQLIITIAALFAVASAEQAVAIEHIFDTADATRIKNEIVSQMLDANCTLQVDTQYKLAFGKQVNPNLKSRVPFPAIFGVSFTVMPQSDKTRVSVFCVVTGQDAAGRVFELRGQRQYDAWLDKFCRRLTAKIEKPISSQSKLAIDVTPSLKQLFSSNYFTMLFVS